MIIYVIRNLINSKVYIGKTTKEISVRFGWHKRDALCGKRKKLYTAMLELGLENFYVEILQICKSETELNLTEEKFILEFNSVINGYNASYKSFGISKHSEEAKTKMSLAKKGKPSLRKGAKLTDDQRKRSSLSHMGFKHSEETKNKLSLSHKGLNTWTTGSKHSEETKTKMSLAKKGKKQEQVECPHCNKKGAFVAMHRWHFNNCKVK